MSSWLSASHPDCRAILIQIVALQALAKEDAEKAKTK